MGALSAQAAAAVSCSYPSLYSATLHDLASSLESGCFTSVDLVKAYVARIQEVNETIRAMVELNPDALSIAASLDAERKSGATRGVLHGIPIVVKDNIATYDQMNNTAGSYALLGAKVPRDSGVVAKLKAAGAIILGKSNMSQWAMYRSTNATSGWTARAGQNYGPYYPLMDPYGSSSGSGVAAGIGLAFAGLGTETRGSILTPASKGNCVGIKPTVGLTSRYLVIPLTSAQDTVGPLARTVYDAATVLSVMAGKDQYDNDTGAIPNDGVLPDYIAATSKYLTPKGANLTGVRIGVPRNALESDLFYGSVNETLVLQDFEKALDVLRSLGAEVIDAANFTQQAHDTLDIGLRSSFVSNESINCGSGFVSGMATYFSELTFNPNNLHSVTDLANWTRQDPREDYPDRNVGLWEVAMGLGFDQSDARSWAARQGNIAADVAGGVTGICRQLNLSAVVIPTEYAPTWASSPGLPAISVPMGAYPDDVPILNGSRELISVAPRIPYGLSFLGQKWSEAELIAIAAAFENATNFRGSYVPGPNATMPTIDLADVVSGNASSTSTSTGTKPTSSSSTVPTSAATRSAGFTVASLATLFTTVLALCRGYIVC
ncbi:amidase signature enzyme [Thozetella sp. PMI_491]|nr:amidase signature enzyme [Thozetella sp. PMI_491]